MRGILRFGGFVLGLGGLVVVILCPSCRVEFAEGLLLCGIGSLMLVGGMV